MPSRREKRSRSRSRSPKHKKSDKSEKKKSRSERKRKREEDTSRASQSPPPAPKEPREQSPEEGEVTQNSGNEISLSIAETNKLRAKLGLAPLDVETEDKPKIRESESGDPREKIVTEDGNEFVHRIPENLGDKKSSEKIREKLQAQKDKRKLMEKMSKHKGLADDDDDDSAASWVNRSRKIEEERKLAEKRAKEMEDMDEQFGVGALIEEETTKRRAAEKTAAYSARNLAGLRVEHSKDAFLEGKDTVLVLKDKGVLDEDDEEVLINPTMVEHEMWKNNAELRKKKPTYTPYDEEDADDFATTKPKGLLSKYDEELDGVKKEGFQIDTSGTVDVSKERRLAEIKASLKGAQQSLHIGPLKIANEYFTHDEMASFKKPKKKKEKKLRKKQALKADDLIASESAAGGDKDFGSRKRGKGRKKGAHEGEAEAEEDLSSEKDTKVPPAESNGADEEDQVDDDDDIMGPDEDLSNIVVEDDAEDELQAVLDRTRKLKQRDSNNSDDATRKITKLVQSMPPSEVEIKKEVGEEGEEKMEEDEDEDSSMITLDSTSEYCRGLGSLPQYGSVSSSFVSTDDNEASKAHKKQKKKKGPKRHEDLPDDEFEQMIREQEESKGKWVEADFEDITQQKKEASTNDEPSTSSRKRRDDDDSSSDEERSSDPVLGKESTAGGGVIGAIKLALEKGYIDKDRDDGSGTGALKHLEAQRYTVVDKQFHDIDDKYAKKLDRMGMGGGPTRTFEDKEKYEPSFNLTYVDEHGRHMDTKEAFRFQSWKFHGKTPGKKKIEKRTRQAMEKELMKHMNSSDTPLGTLSKQLEKQKVLQVPYIALSGSGSKDIGTSIKKD